MKKEKYEYLCVMKIDKTTGYSLFSSVSKLHYMIYGFYENNITDVCIIKLKNHAEKLKIFSYRMDELLEEKGINFIQKMKRQF